MIFVLSGVETNNKGAELMLYAILQEIERRFPDSTVYISVGSIKQELTYISTSLTLKRKPIERLCQLSNKWKIDSVFRRLHIPKIIDDIYAVKNADFFLDASGLAFSDHQKSLVHASFRIEHLLKNQKKAGSKLIFLPQAFGPIEMGYTQKAIKSLNKYADLVYAREKTSFNYLKKSNLIDMDKVRTRPDFTSLVNGIVPNEYEHLKGGICLIPNMRMIDKGIVTKKDYIRFFVQAIKKGFSYGHKVFLLNHEGIEDEKLALECQKEIANANIEVVSKLNALQTKGLISTAYAVISSRYHGVASALSSGVPCLATSWSHKYAELFLDYGLQNNILDISQEDQSTNQLEALLAPEINKKIREKLIQEKEKNIESTKEMWDEIWAQKK